MALHKAGHHAGVALLAAGLMLAGAGEGRAQDADGAVRLSGSVQLGPDLSSVAAMTAPGFETSSLEDAAPATRTAFVATPTQPDTGSASALPWYERFTVAPSESYAVWGAAPREFQLQAGDRWGVTLGYSQAARSPQDFSLDDFSAGAFFEFSERVRVGGELRFTSPEEEIFGEDTERKTPQLRFESAFRF